MEGNDIKRRTGIYINNKINCVRPKNLETKNMNLVIIDKNGN